MIPAWTTSYLTIPYRERGRSRTGVDCYGLVRLVFQERRGIELPSYDETAPTPRDVMEIQRLLAGAPALGWIEVLREEAQEYDGIVFTIAGQPTHFGLVLEPPHFLHAIKDTKASYGKVAIRRWDSMMWRQRVAGVVRWT